MKRWAALVVLAVLVVLLDQLLTLALAELDAAERARDELRSRIQHFMPVWRRVDRDWDGARW